MSYRPETRARAILMLTEDQSEPMAYGDVDIDPERARLLRALTVVKRIADRLPIPYDPSQALDAYQRLAKIDEVLIDMFCWWVDSKERMAMATAMAMILRRSPRQGPRRPPATATETAPRDRVRLHLVALPAATGGETMREHQPDPARARG